MAGTSKLKDLFVSNIDWRLLWYICVILSTVWLGLAALVPDAWFKPIAIVVGAVQNGFLVAVRGGKYVTDRTLDPPKDLLT